MSKLNTLKKVLDNAGVEYHDIQEGFNKKFIDVAYKVTSENIQKLKETISVYPYNMYNTNIVSIAKSCIR